MSATRALEGSRVGDVMTREAECIDGSESVVRAAELLAEAGVGALPVCDGEERIVGMITDRDIVVRVLAQGADPARVSVAEVADPDPVTLGEHATLEEARGLMRRHAIRRLPVAREGRIVGIVAHSDLLGRAGSQPLVDAERAIAEEEPDHRSAAWLLRRGYRDYREQPRLAGRGG